VKRVLIRERRGDYPKTGRGKERKKASFGLRFLLSEGENVPNRTGKEHLSRGKKRGGFCSLPNQLRNVDSSRPRSQYRGNAPGQRFTTASWEKKRAPIKADGEKSHEKGGKKEENKAQAQAPSL